MATSGKLWREQRNRGAEVEFPSGFVGRVRPVTAAAFLRLPTIPDTLTPVVHDMLYGKSDIENTPDHNVKFDQVLDALFEYAVVDPCVVKAPTDADDEVWIGDIDFDDKVFLLGLVNKTVRQLESFRPQPKVPMESVPS